MNNLAQATPAEEKAALATHKMGRMLVESGKITMDDLKSIIAVQNERGLRFGDAAVLLGLVRPADIKAVLAQQFAYTSIPDQDSKLDPSLSAAFRPDCAEVEALRGLRSELMLRYFNTAPHLSLSIVGAESATGIAHTAANLAIVFSQMGLRTLLVDGNLRQPQMNTLFGISSRHSGLSDLVAGRVKAQPLGLANLPFLSLLTAGTQAPNPQELLSSRSYRETMIDLANSYDVTLINTPPMDSTHDAQIVAAHSGAALLVAKEHSSRMKGIESTCTSLWGVGVRLLGVALRQ